MAENLEKFPSGPMTQGISPRTPDFQAAVSLSQETTNLTQGMEEGLAVRSGFSPIPGQNDNETGTLNPRLPGLMMSEGAPSIGLAGRSKVYGYIQLSLPDASNIKNKITVYGALISIAGVGEYLDISLCSTWTGTNENISANIYDGAGMNSVLAYNAGSGSVCFLTEGIIANASGKSTSFPQYLRIDDPLYTAPFIASFATINVTGADIPTAWLLGDPTASGSATRAPSVAFFGSSMLRYPGGGVGTTNSGCGIPTEYQLQNFKTTTRPLRFTALTNTGAFNISYVATPTPDTTIFKQDLLGASIVNLDMSAVTAQKTSAGVGYAATKAVLVNDSSSISNSSFSAVAVAAKKPYLCLFQGAYRCSEGKFNQWFDLTQSPWQPPALQSLYDEDQTIGVHTCFATWPIFLTGVPMAQAIIPNGPQLGAVNSGILRTKTTYEFTYSIYNKRLNFETNVGTPVKFRTGTDDFVSLKLWDAHAGGGQVNQYSYWQTGATSDHWMPYHFASFVDSVTGWTSPLLAMNFCEYRFYYRQFGTFEWLPAVAVDAAQFWFDPFLVLTACTGSISATPGGQPGAFSDFSPLPVDNYNCVVQYKNRFFWFSDQACVYSLSDNPFAYAARNSISANTGKYLGGIVHNYPGQAEQTSRLVIFGTTGNFVARFTGNFQQTQVQVSADTSATFDIEGSDLVIDPWTNVTAFSHRAAAIAEGILYYWGPQGVYRDDGVNTPVKISGSLEPYLFTIYDPNKTSDIHAHYDDLTKEITWFFSPKVDDGKPTHTLVFSTLARSFLQGSIGAKVDWVQSLPIESNIGTAGKRSIAGMRATTVATTQRAYFYDNRNRSGDMAPKKDWMIKAISTPSAGVRRLTLAAGYDATNFATIIAGNYVALQQTKAYNSSLTSADDMIARIAAVNTGSGYLDITLPVGASMDTSASPTFDKYFPIWISSLNSIAYKLKTVYWTPAGDNGYFFWLYWYLRAKMTLWKSDADHGWDLSYRAPTALADVTDSVTFENNSDGNYQVYHPLEPGDDNSQGQGLKLTVSGSHIGNEWVLQWMEIHGKPQLGDMLKRFEG